MNKILSLLTVITLYSFHSAMGSRLAESDSTQDKVPALSSALETDPYKALKDWSEEYQCTVEPPCDWPGTLELGLDDSSPARAHTLP